MGTDPFMLSANFLVELVPCQILLILNAAIFIRVWKKGKHRDATVLGIVLNLIFLTVNAGLLQHSFMVYLSFIATHKDLGLDFNRGFLTGCTGLGITHLKSLDGFQSSSQQPEVTRIAAAALASGFKDAQEASHACYLNLEAQRICPPLEQRNS